MGVLKNITEAVGNTPLLQLSRLASKHGVTADIYAKLEYFNPSGSVKDRIAVQMIKDAEQNGLLKKGSVIIEPTSGNTGIGLAFSGTALGYRTILVMPDTMSVERRSLMKIYGAEIVLSDGKKGMKGAIEKANELKNEIENSIILGQFENPSNPKAHFENTGREIYDDLNGNVDVVIAGVGTGGTITGVGKYLKGKNKNIKVIAVEPDSSAVLSGEKSGPHKIQGIGAGFVPPISDTDIYDEIIRITNEEAYEYALELPKTEGVFTGISSGAALAAAIKTAKREEYKNKNIVVILPDSGDRYLSLLSPSV